MCTYYSLLARRTAAALVSLGRAGVALVRLVSPLVCFAAPWPDGCLARLYRASVEAFLHGA